MQGNRVRIVDIAEKLGLSTATVSNVIHGKTSKMSPHTLLPRESTGGISCQSL